MKFTARASDRPDINLIPFIDVLLVIIIFLVLTTTYSKFTELQVQLPVADAEPMRQEAREIIVAVGADGTYAVNKTVLPSQDARLLAEALRSAASGMQEPVLIISADANATHQSVVTVMEAAQGANLPRITFATQKSSSGDD